jgi:hypothetical protein
MTEAEIPAQNHPEQKAGMVFLCNCYLDEPDEFANISYQTKVAGKIAYDPDGQVLTRHFPVFISQAEHNLRHKEVKIGQ